MKSEVQAKNYEKKLRKKNLEKSMKISFGKKWQQKKYRSFFLNLDGFLPALKRLSFRTFPDSIV